MKVEYSYYGDAPCLVIKGGDFIKALKNRKELFLLEVAVDGFCAKFNVTTHFSEEVNESIAYYVGKTGDVIYTIRERWIGNHCMNQWCEVYVEGGTHRHLEIVVGDDYGRSFSLRRKEDDEVNE